MQKQHCDICGVETFINPDKEYQYEMVKVKAYVPDDKGGVKEVELEEQRPVMSTVQKQNPFSGLVEEKQVHKFKDLQERSYYLQLTMGGEFVIRDVCRTCLDKEIMPLARPLWDKLASLTEKD